jgi:hypothetical protein
MLTIWFFIAVTHHQKLSFEWVIRVIKANQNRLLYYIEI